MKCEIFRKYTHKVSSILSFLKERENYYKNKRKKLKTTYLQDSSWSLCEFSHYEESVELIFLCNWDLNGGWILGLGGNEIGEVYTSGKNNIILLKMKKFGQKDIKGRERLRLLLGKKMSGLKFFANPEGNNKSF